MKLVYIIPCNKSRGLVLAYRSGSKFQPFCITLPEGVEEQHAIEEFEREYGLPILSAVYSVNPNDLFDAGSKDVTLLTVEVDFSTARHTHMEWVDANFYRTKRGMFDEALDAFCARWFRCQGVEDEVSHRKSKVRKMSLDHPTAGVASSSEELEQSIRAVTRKYASKYYQREFYRSAAPAALHSDVADIVSTVYHFDRAKLLDVIAAVWSRESSNSFESDLVFVLRQASALIN